MVRLHSNLDNRNKRNLSIPPDTDEILSDNLPSMKALEDFVVKIIELDPNTKSSSSYIKCNIMHSISYNLFESNKELSLFQCVSNAFYNHHVSLRGSNRKQFTKLYNELHIQHICVNLYDECSAYMKKLDSVRTFSSIPDLFMRYIHHVGSCEGCLFLDSSYAKKSESLRPEEIIYINELFDNYNKYKGIDGGCLQQKLF